MKHAARKTTRTSRHFRVADVLAPSPRGSHAAHAVRGVRAMRADGAEQTLGLDPALAAKLEEVAPLTRRAIRESARAARRKSRFMASGSMVALAGAVAGGLELEQYECHDVARFIRNGYHHCPDHQVGDGQFGVPFARAYVSWFFGLRQHDEFRQLVLGRFELRA